MLERIIAAGCNSIVFCGGAGVLVPQLSIGQVIVTTAAVRDEGTSFHYLPPGREVAAHPAVVRELCGTCERAGVRHIAGSHPARRGPPGLLAWPAAPAQPIQLASRDVSAERASEWSQA